MAEGNQKMMRILVFSTAYLPLQGGAELAVKEITDRLGSWEFDLICARIKRVFKKEEKIGNVNVYRIGFGSTFDKLLLPVFGCLKARKIYKKENCHSEFISESPTMRSRNKFGMTSNSSHLPLALWGVMASWGSLAGWLFKIFNPKVPFLLTLQEGDAEAYIKKGRSGLVNLGWRLILKKADYVQVISKYLAEMARKYGYKGKIDVVPNGVSIEKFQYGNLAVIARSDSDEAISMNNSGTAGLPRAPRLARGARNDDIKKQLGIESDEKIIITVSRLVEKNAVGDIIEAVSEYSENYPSTSLREEEKKAKEKQKIKLIIIGGGPLEKNLKLKTKNLKLEDKVIFLGDVPNEEVPKYLAISDVFVRPSLSEGLGTAFLEAMAAGVPIIGTKVGGIPDFLKDRETGLFCEVKNPKSIAEKINLILTDNGLREKIIANSKKLVEEKYDWDKIARKIEGIFNKLIN